MTNKYKFDYYLLNYFINNKNFLVYETKNQKIIKFATRIPSKNYGIFEITSKVVARMTNQEYQHLIDYLEKKFGHNSLDGVAAFNYLCGKFNLRDEISF